MEETTTPLCPGRFRVNRGKWYTPIGKTPRDVTYCEWCIDVGKCVQLADGFTVNEQLNQCLCDCPVKDYHDSIKPYTCETHLSVLGGRAMDTCQVCWRTGSTRSTAQKYCDACSALHGICGVCGVDRKGSRPFAPKAKMLSIDSGRVRED